MESQAQQATPQLAAGSRSPGEATLSAGAEIPSPRHTALVIGHDGLRFQPGSADAPLDLDRTGELIAPTRECTDALLQFAIELLGVRQIAVLAHPAERKAAEPESGFGWHRYTAEAARRYQRALANLDTAEQRQHVLQGLSAVEQALALSRSPAVLAAWRRGWPLAITVHAADSRGDVRALGPAVRGPCLVDDIRRNALGELLNQTRTLTRRRRDAFAALTPRELHVLSHLCDGISNVEISRRLGISRNTVSSHLRSIYDKLGVCQRLHAVLLASRLRSQPLGTAGPGRAWT